MFVISGSCPCRRDVSATFLQGLHCSLPVLAMAADPLATPVRFLTLSSDSQGTVTQFLIFIARGREAFHLSWHCSRTQEAVGVRRTSPHPPKLQVTSTLP